MHSFVDLTRYILTTHSEDNLLLPSEHLSQDPLENYFGKQRARGGRSDNPTVQHSNQNPGALWIQRSLIGFCLGKLEQEASLVCRIWLNVNNSGH